MTCTEIAMHFQIEKVTDSFLSDALPLFQEHWNEVCHYNDLALEPDIEQYKKFDSLKLLRVFTARDNLNKLVGYCIYFVYYDLHCKSLLQAIPDLLFITKSKRGFGKKFIEWCDEALIKEGVKIIYKHVNINHSFGPMLERIGYKLIDQVYARRIN